MTPKILTTLRETTWPQLGADVVAGVTVAMVALPLSVAIAIASGATPAAGLVTAIVAGFLISALGGSRVQIGGPTGAFIVVVAGVIAAHGYDGLLVATFMAGLILIAAGVLRAGRLVAYVPEAVVNGFTIGIAIIIASSQLRDALGVMAPSSPSFLTNVSTVWAARESASVSAVLVTLVTAVLIVALRRAAPRWPGLIVAVAVTSAAVVLWDLPVDTVGDRFGALPDTLPAPALPPLDAARLAELLPSALTIAFLAGVESLLSAMVADRMIGSRHRSNAEIVAQGVANVGSSLFGGLPATGAIARTATNVRAGGRTPIAGMVHALALLVAMMAAAPLVGMLAMPALAAVLILTAWNMSEPWKWRTYWRVRPADRVLLVLTLTLTVLADLTVAIGVGVALGLAIRLQRRAVPGAEWSPPER